LKTRVRLLPLPEIAEAAKLEGEPFPADGVTVMLVEDGLIVPAGYPVPAIDMFEPTNSALVGDVRFT